MNAAAIDALFGGQKITVMGLGLLGRGIGDIKFLAAHGAELIVTDLKPAEALASSVAELAAFPGIVFHLGEHRLEDFRGRDLILKAAGVPQDSPFLAEARKEDTPIRMSADLFAEYAGVPVIGVTGTRGKTTTTYLIETVLKAAGKKTLLGGNIRGVSTLSLLDEVEGDEVAVLELDSWQLQGFGDAHLSPHVAVFTTFFPDHLNYYQKGGMSTEAALDAYLADKANVFFYQHPEDTLVLGSQCAPLIVENFGEQIESHTVVAGQDTLPADWQLRMPGDHNRYDAGLALAVARVLDIDDAVSRQALESFPGVPGRLECISAVNGVNVYNDTTATTPDATLAALRALDTGKRDIVLIMGGADKNLDMNRLLVEIPKAAKRVIMLAGTGTDRVLEFLPEASVFDNLKDAVDEAFAAASPGDRILFSPAFASFGLFKNEYDRGDQFSALVAAVPDLAQLRPKVRTLARALMLQSKREGCPVMVVRGFRTTEQQDEYYAQGRTKPGAIITNAKGGESFHNYGVAFDVRPLMAAGEEGLRDERLEKAGAIGQALGLEWGGTWTTFPDAPHFQYTAGYSIDDFKQGKIDEDKFLDSN